MFVVPSIAFAWFLSDHIIHLELQFFRFIFLLFPALPILFLSLFAGFHGWIAFACFSIDHFYCIFIILQLSFSYSISAVFWIAFSDCSIILTFDILFIFIHFSYPLNFFNFSFDILFFTSRHSVTVVFGWYFISFSFASFNFLFISFLTYYFFSYNFFLFISRLS